tara:strand:- start:170 stop:754 length:585 start_codon:yes stop_codon:yes gene_type:complete
MANEAQVFGAGRPKVWSIPPGADFLRALANTLAQETSLADQPDALSAAIIYVPNSRSARALTLALFDAAGGKPILPPDVRTLGDLESEEAPPNAETALAGLPPAMSPARRLGALASLVRGYYAARYRIDLPPASALAAARELSRLLDQAALSEQRGLVETGRAGCGIRPCRALAWLGRIPEDHYRGVAGMAGRE